MLQRAEAFEGCRELRKVQLPSTLAILDSSAFRQCSKLTDISLPDSLVSLGTSVFESCGSLQEISVPKSLRIVHYNAFFDCNDLKYMRIPFDKAILDKYMPREQTGGGQSAVRGGQELEAQGMEGQRNDKVKGLEVR